VSCHPTQSIAAPGSEPSFAADSPTAQRATRLARNKARSAAGQRPLRGESLAVIPAQAGICPCGHLGWEVPAFAGVTSFRVEGGGGLKPALRRWR